MPGYRPHECVHTRESLCRGCCLISASQCCNRLQASLQRHEGHGKADDAKFSREEWRSMAPESQRIQQHSRGNPIDRAVRFLHAAEVWGLSPANRQSAKTRGQGLHVIILEHQPKDLLTRMISSCYGLNGCPALTAKSIMLNECLTDTVLYSFRFLKSRKK